MCGIAGVVAFEDRYRVSRELLARMSAAIAHRGPDDERTWFNHDTEVSRDHPQCALAFRRLSILDLDPRANQPMTDGRRWIVFNGEIYNFRELRRELDVLRENQPWKTTGDTEVILRACDQWGEACVEHFNGMFAFAIWDERDKALFLARDRMGQKPLYFAAAPGHAAFAFASELQALRALDWIDWSVEPAAVGAYLQTGYIPARLTIYKGVSKLSPATRLTINGASAPASQSYFDPNQISSGKADVDAIRDGVLRAVKRQLVSDVPIGCFLSGGIDSSVIAAAMRASIADSRKLLTFSIGFDDPRYDERAAAAVVARHLKTEHREFVVKPDAAADLPRLAKVFGEPFGDSSALPVHYLSQQTRPFVKVALSGDGGDELFGGYDRYRAMKWGGVARRIPRFAALARLLPGSHPKSLGARFKRFADASRLPDARRYSRYVSLFDPAQVAELYPQHPSRDDIAQFFEKFDIDRDPVQAALATDRVTYLPGDLLTKLDRASMLHNLEVRSPFMDHELVSMTAGLSTSQLLGGGSKSMLRRAFAQDLPAFVFHRRKMGFAVPIGQWLREGLRPMLRDSLHSPQSFAHQHFDLAAIDRLMDQHQREQVDHSQRLYALLMLELWWTDQGIKRGV